MLVTKDLDNKLFGYIYTWGETLAYMACAIRASYHRTFGSKPVQDVFGWDILFNLASFLYWWVINTKKQRQLDIDNVQGNASKFTHDYAVGDLVYVKVTEIYRKLGYKK